MIKAISVARLDYLWVLDILPLKATNSCLKTFESITNLEAATKVILNEFTSGISSYQIQKSGVLEEARGVEDGRTEDLTLEYDSVTADEDWGEFMNRLNSVGKNWHTELWNEKERSYGRQVVRGVETPEYS